MIVEIRIADGRPSARLLEPEVFTSFKALLHDDRASLEELATPLGVARVDEHVWIRVEALRDLAGAAATAEWERSLEGMLTYARSKGWVDDEAGAVRAHVERAQRGAGSV